MDCNTIVCSKCEINNNMVVLIPNREIRNVENTCNYRLIIACNINTPSSDLPLSIQVGTNDIPVLCKYGNQLYASQVKKRVNYPIGYGNQNDNYSEGQFVILSCNELCPRKTEIPISL